MLTTHEVDKGTATALRVELRNPDGSRARFAADDQLRAKIFDGDDNSSPLARPAATWADAETGLVDVMISESDVRDICPGLWLLEVVVVSLADGLPRLAARAWLHVRGGPG